VTEHHETYYTCDRCGERFETRGTFSDRTVTAKYALMVLTNGSGSRVSTPGRDLDQDLCEPCAAGLLAYLKDHVDDHGSARVAELLDLRTRLDAAVEEERDLQRPDLYLNKVTGLTQAIDLVNEALTKRGWS
jgi:hypothetical protein